MVLSDSLQTLEREITNILKSIIVLYGNDGLPLDKVDEEFMTYCGYPIPYSKFGCDSLRSYLLTLPEIYIVSDTMNTEVLIQHSQKSTHIKELILKQKPSTKRQVKRKTKYTPHYGYPKMQRYNNNNNNNERNFAWESFYHASSHDEPLMKEGRFDQFEQLESMLPLFYKHQALGDDFFVDIADTKMGYYVPENGPKKCGLCSAGQTISELTYKVKNAKILAPRVVVMIGFQDLIAGKNVNHMIYELRQLVIELKKKNTRVTLITLIESPKLPNIDKLYLRMDIFNQAILDYANDPDLQCNIIDMNAIFEKEADQFKRDFDRFTKVAKKDEYKVFSDYGRKIFLSSLKFCLKEQIEAGH